MRFKKKWLKKSPTGEEARIFNESRNSAYKAYEAATNKKQERIAYLYWQAHIPPKARRKHPYGLSKYDADLISETLKTFPQYGEFNLMEKLGLIPRWKIYEANPMFMAAFEEEGKPSGHYKRITTENGLLKSIREEDGIYELTDRGRKLQTAIKWRRLIKAERADLKANRARNRRDIYWALTAILVAALGFGSNLLNNYLKPTDKKQPNVQYNTLQLVREPEQGDTTSQSHQIYTPPNHKHHRAYPSK